MSVEGAQVVPQGRGAIPILGEALRLHWPLILGFGVMAVPTILRLAQQVWPMEIGAHGPIVLATGIWLLFHVRSELVALASPPANVLGTLACLLGAGVYAFGRPFDLLSIEAVGVYLFFLGATALIIGLRPMMNSAFPFLYLAFLVPIPGWIIDQLTMPLQMLVSSVSTGILTMVGYPIAREGIVINIAQYTLLVEDACSGMNSLIGLMAVMLFYIYIIHRASLRYSLILAAAVIPIAVFVNIIRIITLILLTYYQGDAVAQGFLHKTTGVVLFAFALGFTILFDKLVSMFFSRGSRASGGSAYA